MGVKFPGKKRYEWPLTRPIDAINFLPFLVTGSDHYYKTHPDLTRDQINGLNYIKWLFHLNKFNTKGMDQILITHNKY